MVPAELSSASNMSISTDSNCEAKTGTDSTNNTSPAITTTEVQKESKELASLTIKCDEEITIPSSPTRFKRESIGGLSELSKQLRVLQAKNQSQSIEIDRLERQLRILADLQGISVGDLRSALDQACEAEALGEWQHRVASLRAQLEAASVSSQSATRDAANVQKIATLELRVGELEEVEEKQRSEIQGLYAQLMEGMAKVMHFETLYMQQCVENENIKMSLSERSAMSIDAEHDKLTKRASEAELGLRLMTDRLALYEQQHKSAENQAKLRNAQFKARFLVQEENINDLRQQLSSLYVAFDMLREERDAEEEKRTRLQTNLYEADAQVARQVGGLGYKHPTSSDVDDTMEYPKLVTPPKFSKSTAESKSSGVTSQDVSLGDLVHSGQLLVRSTSFLKKWKNRNAQLYSTLTHHNLLFEGIDRIYCLEFGVTKVEAYLKQPFTFVIHLNPGNPVMNSLYAGTTNERDYNKWMTALTIATTGEETLVGDSRNST